MKPLSTKPGAVFSASTDSGSAPDDASSSDVQLRLEEFLPYRLVMLAEQVSQSMSRLYSDRYGLTNPEWRTLAALGQFGRMTSTEIGRHSRMHKTKVSRSVAELEKKDLIVRKTSDADMRVAHLTLTAKGDRLAGGLTPEELSVLERVLTSLMEHSDEIAREISDTIGNGTA
jgi:DNA-binding MarR family transcriptional regulator